MRTSKFELMRIVLMLMIISHHFYVHGVQRYPIDSFNGMLNYLLMQFLGYGGKISVIVFVILSGYYLIFADFSLKKYINLLITIWSIDILCLIFGLIAGSDVIDLTYIIKALNPFTSNCWFASTYIVFYIFTPIINYLFKKIEYQKILFALILGIVVHCLISILVGLKREGSNFIYFFYWYTLGAFIRIRIKIFKLFDFNCYKVFLASLIIVFLSIVLLDLLSLFSHKNYFISHSYYFVNYNSPLALLHALSIFMIFKNIKIKDSKIINGIASHIFGVYLIHDNPAVREILWNRMLNNSIYITSSIVVFFLMFFYSIFLVFATSIIIDYVRCFILNKVITKSTQIIYDCIDRCLSKYKYCIKNVLPR